MLYVFLRTQAPLLIPDLRDGYKHEIKYFIEEKMFDR